MAYAQVKDESLDTVQERAVIGRTHSNAVRNDDVQHVTHGERVIEIPKIDHKALGRPTNIQYERNLASVQSRLKAVGVSPATVLNWLPMILQSSSYIDTLRKARVMPPKDNQPYSTFVIRHEEIVPTQMGADAPLLAFDIHPIQLADEFPKLFSGMGGVMCFPGLPSDMDDPDWKNRVSSFHGDRTYGEVMEECRQRAVEWMRQMLVSGTNKKSMGHTIFIHTYEKDAARRLLALGDITELPDWVEEKRDLNVKRHSCPKCQKPVEPGIAQCLQPNCGFIVNPRLAYEIGAIAEDHPSLERLTREEVIAMKISDYVAETIDEKPQRLALGDPKPLSLAVMRMQQINDELNYATAKQNATLIADEIDKKAASKPEKPDKG